MDKKELSNSVRRYLIKMGLDFAYYGSVLVKETIMMMLDEADIVYNREVYQILANSHNKEIDTIKKDIFSRVSS